MKKIISLVLITLGSVLAAYGIALLFITNFSAGTAFVILLGAAIILLGAVKKMRKWIRITLIVLISYALLATLFVTVYGKTDNVTYDEDAIIVLGAAVHGEKVGSSLAARLDRAVEYHRQNPDALIVVSGGRGAQEDITEALAMERYLLERGVAPDVIIKEEKATGTDYNFMYSKQLLDERLGDDYTVAFITTDYHIFRAEFTARKAGFEQITHAHSAIELWYYLPSTLREVVAIICYWLLK